jgi:hypothetical protein
MSTASDGPIARDTGVTPRVRDLVWRSVILGPLIAWASGILCLVCSEIFSLLQYPWKIQSWGTGWFGLLLILSLVSAALGAVGGAFIVLLFRLLRRFPARKELSGAASGALVGLLAGLLLLLVVLAFSGEAGAEAEPTLWVATAAWCLGIPTSMGLAHGWLLARWSGGERARGEQLAWSVFIPGAIGVFFVLFSLVVGASEGLLQLQQLRARRQAAALSPEAAADICRKLAISGLDPRCQQGAKVRASEFFSEIRTLPDKGVTYEQVEDMFGVYKVSCGITLHKTPGDEGYFLCRYDLNGSGEYWFVFEFTAGGTLRRVSTSSTRPPP